MYYRRELPEDVRSLQEHAQALLDIDNRIEEIHWEIEDLKSEEMALLVDAAEREAAFEREPLHLDGYAWPGGYPLGYLTRDSDVLCWSCAEDDILDIVDTYIVEEGLVMCDQCSKVIHEEDEDEWDESVEAEGDDELITLNPGTWLPETPIVNRNAVVGQGE